MLPAFAAEHTCSWYAALAPKATTIPLLLHPFNGLFSRTTWVNRYQKGKTSLDLNKARDDGVLGWQWHQLDHMQTICTSLQTDSHTNTNTRLHPFNGPLSGTTQVSRYQKGKTNLDFTEARDSEWQWHQLGLMPVCTLLQTDNHASTPVFYRPDALPATQPTASKH